MQQILTLDDYDFKGKTALVRVDFNSPVDLETKKILDTVRIRVHGETTLKELVQKNTKVVVLAHQGRRGEPDFIPLKQHADILSQVLGKPVKYVDSLFGEEAKKAIKQLENGEILVLENVRTYVNETDKGTAEEHAQTEFVKSLAPLANVFVNDAFAAAHRSHVSIIGFTAVLPAVAGRIMERELNALGRALTSPERPCTYILGGAKADDALGISQHVLDNNKADYILAGGVAGHLFLSTKGVDLGKPNIKFLEKKDLTRFAPGIKKLITKYPEHVKTPTDLALDMNGKRQEIPVEELPTDYAISDIGAETIRQYSGIISKSKSIVVSGPMGIYENKEFESGTKRILEAAADAPAYTLVGGGHTVAAVKQWRLEKKMSYVSTAGGALVEFLMGKKLPGVAALEAAAKKHT